MLKHCSTRTRLKAFTPRGWKLLSPRLLLHQGVLKFSEMTHTTARDPSGIWHSAPFEKQDDTLQLLAYEIPSGAGHPCGWLSSWMADTACGISISTGDTYHHPGPPPISAALHKHFSGRWAALEIWMRISISQYMLSPGPPRTSLFSQMFYLTIVMVHSLFSHGIFSLRDLLSSDYY